MRTELLGYEAGMGVINRVLDAQPVLSLADYLSGGGGEALVAARKVDPEAVVGTIEDSGLRGRGGAGFPTATKWRSVLANASAAQPTPVVINGAEGEPSTFKDRTILRTNPYRVLEGALVACAVVSAVELVICTKRSFLPERSRLRGAVDELRAEGWLEGIDVRFVDGPDAYLFGEETALLEVTQNRQPFPRVSPPWRRGISDGSTNSASRVTIGDSTGDESAPALVNNVETFANVALIVRNGPAWFREVGTDKSPGTICCTIVGDVSHHGVAEFAMGTTLREVIETIGKGALADRQIVAVLPGASGAVVPEALFDTPLTHEAMAAAGAMLGSAGFHCIDDHADPLLLAYGASRFLSTESCGQCTPCKGDGLALTALLSGLVDGTAPVDIAKRVRSRLESVVNEARCGLALQQQVVVGSLVARCGDLSVARTVTPPEEFVAGRRRVLLPLLDIADGVAVFDEHESEKQADWSFDAVSSGAYPAQHLQGVALDAAS